MIDIKFEYLVLVLLDLVNMLAEVLETILSFERSGLVAIRFLASPISAEVSFVGMVDDS